MPAARLSAVVLEPLRDHNATGPVNFNLNFPDGLPAGRWLRIRYHMTLYGSAARPAIRLRTASGDLQITMSAALFGSAEWIGHIPADTLGICISLPEGLDGEALKLVSCEVLSRWHLLVIATRHNPLAALRIVGLRLLGSTVGARTLMEELLGATPLDRYDQWRARNSRPLDKRGMEAPRDTWCDGPHIRVVIAGATGMPADDFSVTIDSLRRQSYPRWSLALVGENAFGLAGQHAAATTALCVSSEAKALALWSDLAPDDIVLPIVPGDVVPAYGFAALAGFSVSHSDTTLFYGDEDSIDPAGRYLAPEFKPDWSPILQQGKSYLGRAVYCRRSILAEQDQDAVVGWTHPESFVSLFLNGESRIGHIRRLLLTKRWRNGRQPECLDGVPDRPAPSVGSAVQPLVTIVIPTRDRADLLAECLSGIELTKYPTFDILIVDNDSVEAKTHALFEQAAARLPVSVLRVAGAFNFSDSCNRAAAVARGRILVFLNNDTRPLGPDWLERLVHWAVRPDVGAVGAKLLYPGGRLQHAGVVLGLGGYAAHIESGIDAASSGYLGSLAVPREVSAVTGACLAVEATKFHAVDGFDADSFPVELGDIDFCLRLADRGCKTVLATDAVLMHRESATRGKARDLSVRYARERANFLASWKDKIANDPYFHPALSLSALQASLDR